MQHEKKLKIVLFHFVLHKTFLKLKKHTLKFPRSVQRNNIALHAHINVTPWPRAL